MSFRFYMLSLKERQNHIKVSSTNILCSESETGQKVSKIEESTIKF